MDSRAGEVEELEAYCCPITLELLVDPVAASDGHTVGRFPKLEATPHCLAPKQPHGCDSTVVQNREGIPGKYS